MRRLIIMGLTLFLAVGACGETTKVLTDADSTNEVLLDSGEQFEVRLESNPGTGYSWVIADELVVPVTLVEERYEEPDTDLVGAPGEQVFVFEAGEEDAGILRLEYIRPFDDPIVPERVVEYIIRVDGAPWPPVDAGTPPSTSTASTP